MTTIFKPMVVSDGGQTQQIKVASSRYVPLAKATDPKNPTFLRQRPTSSVDLKPPPTLRFVNFTNPDQCKSNKNRRLVRSTASKSSGRLLEAQKEKAQNRLRTRKPQNSVSLTGTYSSDGAGLPFAQVKQKASSKECLPILSLEKFGAASCDPFRVYPSCYTSMDVGLVSSYLRLLADPSSVYFNAFQSQLVDKMLIPIALAAPVLYHSFVYTASTHYFGMEGKLSKALPIPLEHRLRAIRLVLESIGEKSVVSDETAFAAALVGITEFLHGDAVHALVHFQGLAQMIKSRGGIRNFRNPLLRNLFTWLHGVGTSSLRTYRDHISPDSATTNSAQTMLALVGFAPLTRQTISQLDSLLAGTALNLEIARAVQKLPRRPPSTELEYLGLEDSEDSEDFEVMKYPTVWKGARDSWRPCNLVKDDY